MSLEQKLERSEALLEVNEQNKQKAEQARRTAQQAQNQVQIGAARVQQAQNRLQQAMAARSAARQQSDDDGGSSSTASWDAAVSDAQAALSAANLELQAARREQIRAGEDLKEAQEQHRESAERLSAAAGELQEVSRKYSIELNKTRQLMNTPEGRLADPLFRSLGAGREQVDDLRRRIAASLGIAMTADSDGEGGLFGGSNPLDALRSVTERIDRTASGLSSLLSPTAGFSRISGAHSVEDDLKHTNPNYSSTDPESAYKLNCQRCVIAYEARRRGYDVEALPALSGLDFLRYLDHPLGLPSVFEGAELVDCCARTGEYAKGVLEEQMKTWGDNCRAIVYTGWKNAAVGHFFIVERINGVTRFLDPQNGNADASSYFSLADGNRVYCMRTDHLPFTGRVRKCCKNRGG